MLVPQNPKSRGKSFSELLSFFPFSGIVSTAPDYEDTCTDNPLKRKSTKKWRNSAI